MSFRAIESNAEGEHAFYLVMPIAERPRPLEACLASLGALLARHPYPAPIILAVVEDSLAPEAIAAHADVIRRQQGKGFQVVHLLPPAFADLAATSPTFFGDPAACGHRGQAAARNLGILWARRQARAENRPALIWSIDSDQLFCLDTKGATIDYFALLDRLFAQTDVLVATGKVVGDPPVSPAVMTGHFLADLIALLERMATLAADSPCTFHEIGEAASDAAYHDMADLFGFSPASHYAYPCPLLGRHSHADCLVNLSSRIMRFWHGEHPTRATAYRAQDFFASLAPARTVYAGNYVFRAEEPIYIPFADLRLRMSGPTLGRILRASIGERFVSANFPLLHRRAACGAGYRPGVVETAAVIDIADEYERQFWGDVMLFTLEREGVALLEKADASQRLAAVSRTADEMLQRYRARRATIAERLAHLDDLLASPAAWWAQKAHFLSGFTRFAATVRHNFVQPRDGPTRIEDTRRHQDWLARLVQALDHYTFVRCACRSLL